LKKKLKGAVEEHYLSSLSSAWQDHIYFYSFDTYCTFYSGGNRGTTGITFDAHRRTPVHLHLFDFVEATTFTYKEFG